MSGNCLQCSAYKASGRRTGNACVSVPLTCTVLWWLPFLFHAFLIVNTERMEDIRQNTDSACDFKHIPPFHHAMTISGDAHVIQVECQANSFYIGHRPSATCKNRIWHTHGECRQYFWHDPPEKAIFFLTLPLTTASRRSFCIWLTPTDPSMFQVTVESEDRMTAIVILVHFDLFIRGNPGPLWQGIHVYTKDLRDTVDHRKKAVLRRTSSFVLDNRSQLKLTAASTTTLVISIDSKKLTAYDAAMRLDLLTSVHVNGAATVHEVNSLCHTCDVKEAPTFPDVEITWQNGSWPLVGSATCKEKGFTWKGPSSSHAMCFADIWSLNGECEEKLIQYATLGKVYSFPRPLLVGHKVSIKGTPSANTSFSLALTKGHDIPVVFTFLFSSQSIIGKSQIMEGDSKKTIYRVFPLVVGQPFAIIITITKMDEVAVQINSLKEPLRFQSTMAVIGPGGVQGFSARGDVIITELNLHKK